MFPGGGTDPFGIHLYSAFVHTPLIFGSAGSEVWFLSPCWSPVWDRFLPINPSLAQNFIISRHFCAPPSLSPLWPLHRLSPLPGIPFPHHPVAAWHPYHRSWLAMSLPRGGLPTSSPASVANLYQLYLGRLDLPLFCPQC